MKKEMNTILDSLDHWAAETPNNIAFTFLASRKSEPISISYKILRQKALEQAQYLSSRNVFNRRVLLQFEPGLEFVVALLACFYSGSIAVPLQLPTNRKTIGKINHVSEDADIDLIFSTRKVYEKQSTWSHHYPKLSNSRWIFAEELEQINDQILPEVDAEQLAFLQYTSGSTGDPKGVMVNHFNLLSNVYSIQKLVDAKPGETSVSWLPAYHDMGLIGSILTALYSGVHQVMMAPMTFIKSPLFWLETIAKYRARYSPAPNFAYELCIEKVSPEQCRELDLSCWEHALNGAEPIRQEVMEQFVSHFSESQISPTVFTPCYGMAETTLLVSGGSYLLGNSYYSVDEAALLQHEVTECSADTVSSKRVVNCGHPFNLDIEIVDPVDSTPCEANQIGEIWVSGDSVAQGYWGKPEITNEIFRARIQGRAEQCYLRTGDYGFMKNGELFVTGRLKDLIILNGSNIYPQDVEYVVESLDKSIGSVVAFQSQKQIALVVETRLKNKDHQGALINKIRQQLSLQLPYPVGSISLIKIGAIPKTSSGKVQRRETCLRHEACDFDIILSDSATNQDTDKYCVSHRPTDISVCEVTDWLAKRIAEENSISVNDIDINQPFLQYGLDSVKAVGICGELENEFGFDVPVALVWEYPTISSLSEYLATQFQTSSTPSKATTDNNTKDLAIIGIGCNFPGARNVDEFWKLLVDGRNAVRSIPLDRWSPVNEKKRRGLCSDLPQHAGMLEDISLFDAGFFGISKPEAPYIDPQQRLLLEATHSTMEDAGLPAFVRDTTRSIGVFIGIGNNDYSRRIDPDDISPYSATGNASSIAANRISYTFNFDGPSLAIDTACSSSMVAIHQAASALLNEECSMALAGGVNLMLSADIDVALSGHGMMSADGRCKTFDQNADGYVRGEGVGLVLLKPLAQAIEDRDSVYAVLKSSVVNQDGHSQSITAPNGLSQSVGLAKALSLANITPETIGMVETHGTGTPLGDPIEIRALQRVLDASHSVARIPCSVGSVKTNLGHLESAAGIAGFIKAVLSIHHGVLPKHLNFETLSSHISFENSRLNIQQNSSSWGNEFPRRAVVSSFGFGGTNGFTVLEQYSNHKEHLTDEVDVNEPVVVALSAHNQEALSSQIQQWVKIANNSKPEQRIGYSHKLNKVRSGFQWRSVAVLPNAAALVDEGDFSVQSTPFKKYDLRPVFVFGGQSSQRPEMGIELYQRCTVFRDHMNECRKVLEEKFDLDLFTLIHQQERNNTVDVQPALFCVEYSLAKLWMSAGIKPAAVVGHSLGEFVAACICGALTLEDALYLVVNRAQLMQTMPLDSVMLSIEASIEAITSLFENQASHLSYEISAFNDATNTVISGPESELPQLVELLRSAKWKHPRLAVSHAFHSKQMDPILNPFELLATEVSSKTSNCLFVSTLTGKPIDTLELTPEYWARQLRKPVLFKQAIEAIASQGFEHFIEISPKPVMTPILNRLTPESWVTPTLSPQANQGEWLSFNRHLADSFMAGFDPKWSILNKLATKPLTLPEYPYQKQKYWLPELIQGNNNNMETKQAPHATNSTKDGALQLMHEHLAIMSKQLIVLETMTGKSAHSLSMTKPEATSSELLLTEQSLYLNSACDEVGVSTEEAVYIAIAKVLNLPKDHVQPHLNTKFDLGFDSLLSAQFAKEMEKQLPTFSPDSVNALLSQLQGGVTVGKLVTLLDPTSTSPVTQNSDFSIASNEQIASHDFTRFDEYVALKNRLEQVPGELPFFRCHEGIAGAELTISDKKYINFSSYNYIGLGGEEEVNGAAKDAINNYGTSASASRPISGEKPIHGELEKKIADFLGTESAVVFLGGHATNETTIGHLFGEGDLILHDAEIHNSVMQGAIMSGATRRNFPHNDWAALDLQLSQIAHLYNRILIVIEGVYSMDGDIPELDRFIKIKKKYQTVLMVDEAHSIGTIGGTGRGIGEVYDVNRTDVDIWMGTLSKSFASCGGYIAGRTELIEYLKYTAPGFLFSVGMSPANAAAALASIELLERQPDRIAKLKENSSYFLSSAKQRNFNTGYSEDTPVIPVIIGDSELTLRMSEYLYQHQINVMPVVYPAVEENAARLRFFISSQHTTEQLNFTLNVLEEALAQCCKSQKIG
ncbi:aminotransferase class I/II-fold pyridoxal phosphate-dependent enzyme [Vibrio sp. TRT 2004]|uniref:aminotransferase class I/II-fold pyridoxal phosphate-dependent enzyme n=1 Tax=Vibrio sp. TRT 2004 TaxID=3418506 RepID=UPI003CFA7F8F